MELPVHPDLKRRLEDLVSSGAYRSMGEVIEEALGLLEGRDRSREARLAALRADIERGLDDLRAGKTSNAGATLTELRSRASGPGANGA